MLIDARTVPENTIITTDVCIVGAGAAGITLAREFIGQEFRVCLLESGGLEFDLNTQSLYEGEAIGLPYDPLHTLRLRYFGGTTNHWAGTCRPLDEIDFTSRAWIPYSGWPFNKDHLDPFYKRAQPICQLGPFTYDAETWEDSKKSPRLPFMGDRVLTKIFQFSPPTRFGQVYRDEIVRADNISTFLYANVVDIETTETAQRVTRLRVATLEGNKFWVVAKQFVLATGGIENARLLLASNKMQNTGLGNQNDLVGRFFMTHPVSSYEEIILLSDPTIPRDLYNDPYIVDNRAIMGVLTLSEEVLRREKLVNFCIHLRQGEEPSEGVRSLKYLFESIRKRDMPDDFRKHLGNVITDIDDVASATYRKLFEGQFEGRRKFKICRLSTQLEQAPNPESRVTLATDRDRLGLNRVRLNLQLNGIEKYSMIRGLEIIGQELGRAGLGRLRLRGTPEDSNIHWFRSPMMIDHHMGTTRMHVDPKNGVVNVNCQVHGIYNLFISGSSVFPTSGYANPTLTIVSLAIRLADYIKGLMA